MSEIELIHPLDMADLLNNTDGSLSFVDVYKSRGPNGEDIFEFPKSGRRFIQDPNAPRKTFTIN